MLFLHANKTSLNDFSTKATETTKRWEIFTVVPFLRSKLRTFVDAQMFTETNFNIKTERLQKIWEKNSADAMKWKFEMKVERVARLKNTGNLRRVLHRGRVARVKNTGNLRQVLHWGRVARVKNTRSLRQVLHLGSNKGEEREETEAGHQGPCWDFGKKQLWPEFLIPSLC